MFKILQTDGLARRGQFNTVHGVIQTPVFQNVGTIAAIKGAVSSVDLKEIGCQVELSNTYHEFEVNKTGYYKITVEGTTSVGFAKKFDGKTATGTVDCVSYGDTVENMEKSIYQSVCYLEKGLTAVAVIYYLVDTDSYTSNITIEYVGEKATDYTVDAATLDDFLIGMNIWEEESGEFGLSTTSTVTFSSGKTVEMTELYIPGTCSSTVREGKNKATVELFGIKKEVEFTAYYLEDLIDSVDIPDIEKYTTCNIAYDGSKKYADVQGEEVTFNFADGTEYVATVDDNTASFVLPNGMEVDAFVGISFFTCFYEVSILCKTS